MKQSCAQVYYGDGKGKTTAAAGAALRCMGAGGRVLFCQFLKSGASSEVKMLEKLGARCLSCDQSTKFLWDMDAAEREAFFRTQAALFDRAQEEIAAGRYDMAVLDEALDVAALGMICKDRLISLAAGRGETEIILTGRQPEPELLELCDYASRIECVKHPYHAGQPARRGVEF